MSVKQDRTYARTAQDLERKYAFGETFAEMLGLINDSRDKVDSVESSLHNEIIEQSTYLARNTAEIVAKAEQEIRTETDESISELSSKVEMKLDANEFNLTIEQMKEDGVSKVYTETGYSFGAGGLDISKTGEEMANKLDHTGMYVKRNNTEILTANHKGVNATNLHAKTYLIIGEDNGRSRFEDYNSSEGLRTGCFWIGG